MTTITTADLTSASTAGTGVFDILMRSVKSHLDEEFKRGAIKGAEYATVYLGSLNLAMQTGLSFLLQKEKTGLEASILEKQLLLAQLQVDKATIELAMLTASQDKIPAEIAQITAQTALIGQQQANLVAEALNTPKQGLKIDADRAVSTQQQLNLVAEKLDTEAKTLLTTQQRSNLTAEAANIPKQGAVIDAQSALVTQQRTNLISENLGTVAKTALTDQQKANAIIEGTVLDAQECKLRAEFDLTVSATNKSAGEILLLAQKTATEKAQILATGVDADSVVGKQKLLYAAQTAGFSRDAEQKAADILVKTWNVRRTTDEATVADATNQLNDAAVGRAVNKLLSGVGA